MRATDLLARLLALLVALLGRRRDRGARATHLERFDARPAPSSPARVPISPAVQSPAVQSPQPWSPATPVPIAPSSLEPHPWSPWWWAPPRWPAAPPAADARETRTRHGIASISSPTATGRSLVACECTWSVLAESREEAIGSHEAHVAEAAANRVLPTGRN